MRTPSGLRPARYRLANASLTIAERAAGLAHRPGVAFVEVPPGDDSDSEGCKESGADRIQVDVAIGDDSLVGLNRHGVVPASTSQQLEARHGRRLGARGSTDFVVNAANQLACFCPGVAVSNADRCRTRPGWMWQIPALWPSVLSSVRTNNAAPITRINVKAI